MTPLTICLAYTFHHPDGRTWETVAVIPSDDPQAKSFLTNRLCGRLRKTGFRLASVHQVTNEQTESILARFASEDATGLTETTIEVAVPPGDVNE